MKRSMMFTEDSNMEKALICLSFDDGRADNYSLFMNILKPLGIPATINITTGYVDGTCPEGLLPSKKKAMTVENVIDISHDSQFEIALHGDCHLNTVSDIRAGRNKLLKWLELPDSYLFGLASPGSGLSIDDFVNSTDPLFKDKILYMRTSSNITKNGLFKKLIRRISRVSRSSQLFRFTYGNTIMTACPDRVIYSIPVMKQNTLEQVESIIRLAIKKKGCLTMMFHSIGDISGEDNWTWNKDDFGKLCDYLINEQTRGNILLLTEKELYHRLRNM